MLSVSSASVDPSPRPATCSADALALVFLLQRQLWFVEHEDRWYKLEGAIDIEHALGALPLRVHDEVAAVEQEVIAGRARFELRGDTREALGSRVELASCEAATPDVDTAPDASCSPGEVLYCQLYEADDRLHTEARIDFDAEALARVEWLTKPFADRWIDADCRLMLDGVASFDIDVFLPAVPGAAAKRLQVIDEATGSAREVMLARGESTTVSVLTGGDRRRRDLRLRCEAEKVDGRADDRRLGFVLVSERPSIL